MARRRLSFLAGSSFWSLILAASLGAAEGALPASAVPADPVSLRSLLREMVDREALARFPRPLFRSLQASSYNRESVHRDRPGWFADSDGIGFIRKETAGGKEEWVILEHRGPGCITKMWTPYFYYDLGDRIGPNVRIYLDGSPRPVIDESLIGLVTAKGSIRPPFAALTARAGDSYLPIPFGRSCKVTLTGRAFYHIINYRAYPEGTPVETFSREGFEAAAADLERTGKILMAAPGAGGDAKRSTRTRIGSGGEARLVLPAGPAAVRGLTLRLGSALSGGAGLRSTVLAVTFDGERTVWCPVGDFFSSADSLHPFHTWERTVSADGTMICRWIMPYRISGEITAIILGKAPEDLELQADVGPWDWDERSMLFHAGWRPDDVAPGTPFQDWNFIDIRGQGVYVGDAWTVLNIQEHTWWGEGDEKIYVDDAWDRGFPTHFGTGTEDYYGWAGGELPTRKDEFDEPFLANVRVGGLDGNTLGYNICTRTRVLDAIPFTGRLRFDMESSFGVDIRNPWNLLGYSAVTFWYALPGASPNRREEPEAAARPILSVEDLRRRSQAIREETEKRRRP